MDFLPDGTLYLEDPAALKIPETSTGSGATATLQGPGSGKRLPTLDTSSGFIDDGTLRVTDPDALAVPDPNTWRAADPITPVKLISGSGSNWEWDWETGLVRETWIVSALRDLNTWESAMSSWDWTTTCCCSGGMHSNSCQACPPSPAEQTCSCNVSSEQFFVGLQTKPEFDFGDLYDPPGPWAHVCGPNLMEHLVRTLKDCRRDAADHRFTHQTRNALPGMELLYAALQLKELFKDKGPYDLNEAEPGGGFSSKGKDPGDPPCPTNCPDTVTLCGYCLSDEVPENILFGFCGAGVNLPINHLRILHLGADHVAGGDDSPESHLAIDLGWKLSQLHGSAVETKRIPPSWDPKSKTYRPNKEQHEKNLDKQLAFLICKLLNDTQFQENPTPHSTFETFACSTCEPPYVPTNYRPDYTR
jgi:hypothetical protein